jgi:Ser/Thr protein kinase RdoA (MazF antagonist)
MDDFYRVSVEEQTNRMRVLAIEALKGWDVTGCEPELLKYRENAVFRVVAPDGRPAALRIHRHGYHSDAELRSELAWMQALRADGIDVPGVVPTRDQAMFTTATVNGVPEPRQVDMMEWLTGQPLGTLENGLSSDITDVYRAFTWVGQLAARLHTHAEAWSPPSDFVRHAWDMDGLVGEWPLWGRFWELESLSPSQRSLIETARMRARQDLSAYGWSPHTYGLIHADLLTDNMILGKDYIKVLDFDDSGFGWYLFDLATILLFFRGDNAYEKIWSGVIEGYRTVRDLTDEQLSYMPLFFLLRSFTYLGWIHTRYETPAAKELAPMLTEVACGIAEKYLSGSSLSLHC